MSRTALTAEEIEELEALRATNDAIGKSFMWRGNWPIYRRLVRRGLVTWGHPPGGFTPRDFAGITITDKGRAALAKAEGQP